MTYVYQAETDNTFLKEPEDWKPDLKKIEREIQYAIFWHKCCNKGLSYEHNTNS